MEEIGFIGVGGLDSRDYYIREVSVNFINSVTGLDQLVIIHSCADFIVDVVIQVCRLVAIRGYQHTPDQRLQVVVAQQGTQCTHPLGLFKDLVQVNNRTPLVTLRGCGAIRLDDREDRRLRCRFRKWVRTR